MSLLRSGARPLAQSLSPLIPKSLPNITHPCRPQIFPLRRHRKLSTIAQFRPTSPNSFTPHTNTRQLATMVSCIIIGCHDNGLGIRSLTHAIQAAKDTPGANTGGKITDWVKSDDKSGEFKRQQSSFRNWISREAGAQFPPEKGRYHLYVSYACPWVSTVV